MIPLIAAVALSQAPAPQADAFIGKVKVQGSSINQIVSVEGKDGRVQLSGEYLGELKRLQSVKVEVLGKREGDRMAVASYRIIDIGGGQKPLVGILVTAGQGLALEDGDADPVMLNVPPRTKSRLGKKIGSKIWVHGKKLVSGELKVLRYGILRKPDPAPKTEPPKPTEPTE